MGKGAIFLTLRCALYFLPKLSSDRLNELLF